MILSDVINLKKNRANSAVVLEQSLGNNDLLANFAMTEAAVEVFNHFIKAVLPTANTEQRAINIYGSYGSGKSHLSVVIARLLQEGANTHGFQALLANLSNSKYALLKENLQQTFLSEGDQDFKPYLVVPLYATQSSTIGDQLVEALCSEIDKHSELDASKLLPATSYDVCLTRVNELLAHPSYRDIDFGSAGIEEYFSIEELISELESKRPDSIEAFQKWHKAAVYGESYDPIRKGGADFVEIYKVVSLKLAKEYNYAGIIILWDEFGAALEDLIVNANRHSSREIDELQRFVETVCAPAKGHTLFVGVSHVTLAEYGVRNNANPSVKEGLEKISGRFNDPFLIELNAGEEQGYHLLDMQKSWTEKGVFLRKESEQYKSNLINCCSQLDMFATLTPSLPNMLEEVYPLHPTTAVVLFGLAKLSQANRTALTFLRDSEAYIFSKEINNHIWRDELVRIPFIVDFYKKTLSGKGEYREDFNRYEKALAKITGEPTEIETRNGILSIIFLSTILGSSLKANEELLACALLDSDKKSQKIDIIYGNLEWLQRAGLIWKNSANNLWQLSGEGGVDVESLLSDKSRELAISYGQDSTFKILNSSPDLKYGLLPMLGEFELAPSESGIIRSYDVRTVTVDTSDVNHIRQELSASIRLLFCETESDLAQFYQMNDKAPSNILYWVPKQNLSDYKIIKDGRNYNLRELILNLIATRYLITESSVSEGSKTQLLSKIEYFRMLTSELLGQVFGRASLTSEESVIVRGGGTPLSGIYNWADLYQIIEKNINASYPKEVIVKAANVNLLAPESIYKKNIISDITTRIFSFYENQSYQDNYFGEKKKTSEIAAIINGVLGANDVFKCSVDGWVFNDLDQLPENLQELVHYLKRKIVKVTERGVGINKLADELMRPPYGIPKRALPIFVALAIKDSLPSLRWVNNPSSSPKAFSDLLVQSVFDDKLFLKFEKFNTLQIETISEIYNIFKYKFNDSFSEKNTDTKDERLEAISMAFFRYIKGLPKNIIESKKLDGNVKSVINAALKVGVSHHEFISKFVEILDIKRRFSNDNAVLPSIARDFYDSLGKVENEALAVIMDAMKSLYPSTEECKLTFISRLDSIRLSGVTAISNALKVGSFEKIKASQFADELLGKPLKCCASNEIEHSVYRIETIKELLNAEPETIAISPRIIPVSKIEPTEPEVVDDVEGLRKQELEVLCSMLIPIISSNPNKPNSNAELQYFISNLQEKIK